jgi:putative endonuclease
MTDSKPWWVYVLLCQDGRTYTGMAQNVEKRFKEHAKGRGAVFTRINKPLCIVAARPFPDRSSASREERALKKAGRYWIKRWSQKNPWPQAES